MRIRTLLTAAVVSAITMVLGLAVASWFITARLGELSVAQEQAQSLSREITDLVALTHEYAMYSEERAARQWRKHHAAILGLLASAAQEQPAIAREALVQARSLSEAFQKLVEARSGGNSLRVRQSNLLVGQLLANTQFLSETAERWLSAAAEQHRRVEREFHLLAITIPVLMLMILALLALLLYRRVLRPLATLHRVVLAVARGDLTQRSATGTRDELGDLSLTFDAMAVDLVTRLRQEIAERTQAARVLAEKEADLAEAQRIAQIGSWRWDEKTDANVVSEELTRIYRREVIPPFAEQRGTLYSPVVWECLNAAVQAAFRRETGYDLELPALRGDGSEIWVHTRGDPLRDGDGKMVGLRGTVQDITSRKLAELALQASEQRFHQLIDQADAVAIQGYRPDGSVVYWNKASELIYGYSATEALGNNLIDLIIPPEMAGEVADAIHAMFATKLSIPSGRLRLRHKLGHPVHVYSSHTVVKVEGQGAELFCMDIDLSELDRAEAVLRKLSEAVAQNPNGILITDLHGRIEYANAAFSEITGFSFAEIEGRTANFLGSPHTPAATYESLGAAIQAGESWRGEFINLDRAGGRQFIQAHVAPIRQADGHISHYVAIHEDITEKKRTAEELDRHRHHLEELLAERSGDLIRTNAELILARDAAEAANRAKSTFLANMSHELHTPMNAIMGLTDLALRRASDPKQMDQLGKVGQAAGHLLAIIDNILDISKLEADRLVLEQAEMKLSAVQASLIDLVGQKAADKGLQLAIDIPPELAAMPLRGDPRRLGQILLNLTANAVKFTSAGSIHVRILVLEDHPTHVLLYFEVSDTGIGIPDEALPRLFSAFEQADGSRTRKYGGTGLGLAISKRLVQLMGGNIGVESQPGVGSNFWFTARLAKRDEEPGTT